MAHLRGGLIAALGLACATVSGATDPGYSVPPVTRHWETQLPFAGVRHITLGSRVVLVTSADGLEARQWTNGEIMWTSDLSPTFALQAGDGRFFAATGADIVALGEVNGRQLWRLPVGAASTPPVYRSGWLIAVDGSERLHGIRAEDGVSLWTSVEATGRLALPPVIDGDRLFTLAADGTMRAWRIADGGLLWTVAGPARAAALLAAHGRVYASGEGRLGAWTQLDGDRKWSYPIDMPVVSRLTADPEHVLLAALDNTVRAHRVTDGHQVWKARVDARVVDGLTTDAGLVFVPLSDGVIRLFWSMTGARAGQLAPTVPNAHGVSALLATGVGTDLRLARISVGDADLRLETFRRAALPITVATTLSGTPVPLNPPVMPPAR